MKAILTFSRVLTIFTCLVAAACAPTPAAQPTAPSAPAQPAQVQPTAAKEITMLYIDNPTWWSEQAVKYTQTTGNKVNWEGTPFEKLHDKMLTAFAAGDTSWDVIHTRDDWTAEFGSRGFLLPLDKYITPEIKSQFPERAWQNLSAGGKIYGVPRYFWLWQGYYNKDILAAAGFKEPPKTWDEVVKFAAAATADTNNDGKIDRWGYCEPWGENFSTNPFLIHLRAAGGDVFDAAGKPTFNSDAGVKALTWMVEMAKTKNYCISAFELMTTGALVELFLQGNVGMIMATPQVYSMANDATKSKLKGSQVGAMLLPGDVVKSGTFAETGGVAIPAKSKNPDGAWKFIQFVTSFEEEKRMALEPGNVPAMIKALDDPDVLKKQPNYSFVKEQMQYPFGTIAHPRASEINGAIARAVIQALHGTVTPKAALDAAFQEVTAIMNR